MQSLSTNDSHPLAPAAPAADARRSFAVFAVCVVAALWLLARPYIGLAHDGVLYLGQVLLRWYPESLGRDLFFLYGSQDKYSVVAPLLSQLYKHVELAHAQVALISLNQIALLLVVLAWIRRAGLGPAESLLAMAALCVMSHNYGGWNIFAFGERFITGRTFAEPLALLGLLALERGRVLVAGIVLALAMLFHPLIAIPAIVVGWVVLVLRDRRWWWALAVVPVVLALAAAGVAPFDLLLTTLDEQWIKAIDKSTGQVFVAGWPKAAVATVVFDCGVLLFAARLFPAQQALLRAAAFATVGLHALSLIGVDGAHNALLTQLQLWRVHWISRMLSIALLPAVLLRTWRRDDLYARILVAAAIGAAITANVRFPGTVAFTAWSGGALWLYFRRPPVADRVLRLALWATGLAAVVITIVIERETAGQLLHARGSELGLPYFVLLAVTTPLFSLPLVFGAVRAWQHGGAWRALVALLALTGAVYGVVHWDQRPQWTRYVENNIGQEHPWDKIIGPTQQVVWWDHPELVWVLLHRPIYYSVMQAGGLVFNRATAIEHQRRAAVVGPIQMQQDVCDMMGVLQPGSADETCWPTMEAIEEACRGDEQLGYFVLRRKLERGFVSEWRHEDAPSPQHAYYLHDCKQIR